MKMLVNGNKDQPCNEDSAFLPPSPRDPHYPILKPRTRCGCCPYGYHIDVDFVHFCKSVSNAWEDGGLKIPKATSRAIYRKGMQSAEFMLGLGNSPTYQQSTMDNILHKNLVHDSDWAEVVERFEKTLRHSSRSTKDLSYCDSLPRNQNELVRAPQLVTLSVEPNTKRNNEQGNMVVSPSEEGSEVSMNTLQVIPMNIRDQIAFSLKRMRELEDMVKTIPVLEVKMSILREEKRQLLDQLKGFGAKVDGVTSEESVNSTDDTLSSSKQKKKVTGEKKFACKISSSETIIPNHTKPQNNSQHCITCQSLLTNNIMHKIVPTRREVGTTCKVVTRDIGVSHVISKNRTVGVNTSDSHEKMKCLRITPVKHEDIAPCPLFLKQLEELSNDSMMAVRKSPMVARLSQPQSTPPLLTFDNSSNTELDFSNLKTPDQLKVCVQIAVEKARSQWEELVSKPSSYSSKKITMPLLKIVEKKDSSVQASDLPKKYISVGIQASVRHLDACVEAHPRVRNIGSGEGKVDVVSCDTCQSSKRKTSTIGKEIVKQRSVGCGCELLVDSRGVDTVDFQRKYFPPIENREVGVNTHKCKLVDASVGTLYNNGTGDDLTDRGVGSVTLCDKCSCEIQNAAKTITSAGGPVQPSRIPRSVTSLPNKSPSYSPEVSRKHRPPLMRRDTYHVEDRPVLRRDTFSHDHPVTDKNKIAETRKSVEKTSERDTKSHLPETLLFIPITDEPQAKIEISKEMKSALKVLNDSFLHGAKSKAPANTAVSIIQKEWFQITSPKNANPSNVEDYLDVFEDLSRDLLHFVVNLPDATGNSALHYAVSHGNLDLVSVLLNSQVANPNLRNGAGYTSVMLVTVAGLSNETDRQVVRKLFEIGDVNAKAIPHGQTALMLASSHGRLDMGRLLIEAGADVNVQDIEGSTALMCAAEHGHLNLVKFLLAQSECDPTVTDLEGSTALTIAVGANHRDIGVLLYAHENFSRVNSPSIRMGGRRTSRGSTPSSTPRPVHPTSPMPSPLLLRKSCSS